MKRITTTVLLLLSSAAPAVAGDESAFSNILENAWAQDDAAATLGEAFHFTVVGSGRAPRKHNTAEVTIEAKADTCYLVPALPTTGGPVKEWDFTGANVLEFTLLQSTLDRDPLADPKAPAERPPARRIAQDPSDWSVPGFCTIKPGKVKLVATVEAPGTKTALRYVVLGVERSAFPLRVRPWLRLWVGDWCDTERREAFFLHPIPGTLVYANGAPQIFVAYNQGTADLMEVTSVGLEHTIGQSIMQVSATPPASLRFPGRREWPGCPDNNMRGPAKSPMSKAIEACYDRMQKKYGKTIARADSEVTALENAGATRIGVDYGPAYDRDLDACEDPLVAKAEKAFNKTVDRIVDALTAKPPTDELSKQWLDVLQARAK